jgi:hypothetical protein
MTVEALLNLAIAASSLITATATVLIAWAAHRFSKEQARQDRQASLREQFNEWNLELDQAIVRRSDTLSNYLAAVEYNSILSSLRSAKYNTGRLEPRLAVLQGHIWWIRSATDPDNRWVSRLDSLPLDDDKLISVMLNGVLDVVKDEVLFFDGGEEDDYSWIFDAFWTETHTTSNRVKTLEQAFRLESGLEGELGSAVDKWVSRQAPKASRTRIVELVRYKLHVELSLRAFFVGRFSNPEIGIESSPRRKFQDGMRSATSRIRSDIKAEFERLLLEH